VEGPVIPRGAILALRQASVPVNVWIYCIGNERRRKQPFARWRSPKETSGGVCGGIDGSLVGGLSLRKNQSSSPVQEEETQTPWTKRRNLEKWVETHQERRKRHKMWGESGCMFRPSPTVNRNFMFTHFGTECRSIYWHYWLCSCWTTQPSRLGWSGTIVDHKVCAEKEVVPRAWRGIS
jgi:hypothetical protein